MSGDLFKLLLDAFIVKHRYGMALYNLLISAMLEAKPWQRSGLFPKTFLSPLWVKSGSHYAMVANMKDAWRLILTPTGCFHCEAPLWHGSLKPAHISNSGG
jgi:hypothetical protein